MIKSIFSNTLLLIFTIITMCSFTQAQQIVRWQKGNPDSEQFLRNKVAVKQVKVNGITVEASIADGFVVDLKVINSSKQSLDIEPSQMSLEVLQPANVKLAYQSPDAIARGINNSAEVNATNTEMIGNAATKTVTETTTTYETPANPTDPPQSVITTTTKIVPDDDARMRAQSEGSDIRFRGKNDSQSVLQTALKASSLASQTSVAGYVYFNRKTNVEQVLLRVPLDNLIVEIPFNAVKKRKLLFATQINFE